MLRWGRSNDQHAIIRLSCLRPLAASCSSGDCLSSNQVSLALELDEKQKQKEKQKKPKLRQHHNRIRQAANKIEPHVSQLSY